jgi:hypothetical protein
MKNIENKASDDLRTSAAEPEALYAAFIQVRNGEHAAHWTRYNFQFAVNFGLLLVIVTSARDSFIAAHLHLISIMGIELSLIWLLLALQSKKLISERWEKLLRAHEDTIARPENRLFQKIEEEDSKKSWWGRNWQNLNLLSWALPSLCLLAWAFLLATKRVG